MTLQASGQITLQDIATEIGEGAPHNLTSFAAIAEGDATITNAPHNLTDWYGYSHIPAAPSSVVIAYSAGPDEIQGTWTDNSSIETGFELEESINAAPFSALTTRPADATSYNQSGPFLLGDSHVWRIRANGSSGDSNWINSNVIVI